MRKIDDHFESLVQAYLDGQADAGVVALLNRRLRDDVEARQYFSEIANLDSALAELSAGWTTAKSSSSAAERAPESVITLPRPRRAWLAAAACLTFAILTTWSLRRPPEPFATVARGAVSEVLAPGSELGDQLVQLEIGTIEVTTSKGAHVVIEAPAKFRFSSAQTLHLIKGRLAAEVPPTAKGFTVITPNGSAVDLGTTFGVDVPQDGEPEIHVFEGEVIAKTSNGRDQSLRGGDAFSLNSATGSNRELRSSAFIRPAEIASLHAGLDAGQQARAEEAVEQWRNDPDLIAAIDFENDSSRTSRYDGTFRMVQGRWPGSRAAEFVHLGDHMKLNVGDDRSWPQLTLAAWVRIDRLGAPYQSLLHTDGWTLDKPGQVHWMINRNATMRLALRGNTLAVGSRHPDGYPDSRTPVLPEQGRWVHLAAVYDSDAGSVRFFLNGNFDEQSMQATAHPARLGPAQIGNWDSRDRKLSGRIDELMLIGRALSDSEMLALYQAGTPYARVDEQ